MENELRCVQRGNICDRDCAKCPLVKDDKELIEAYGYVIKALEGFDTSDMLYDIYMAGVNMTGEYQGCWVRFKDIERIVSKHIGGKV